MMGDIVGETVRGLEQAYLRVRATLAFFSRPSAHLPFLLTTLWVPVIAGYPVAIHDQPAPQLLQPVTLPYESPHLALLLAPVLPAVAPEVVAHGSRRQKLIALTFDACSTHAPGQFDERITKVLVDLKVPATIFLGGKWMLDQVAHTRYLASLPQFELANHTFFHPHMTRVSLGRMKREIEWTQQILYTLTGRQATLFRAPYGEYDDRLVRTAASLGLTTVQFDLASGDPDPHIGKDRLIDYVSRSARDGAIIVMHINRRGWHTAEALPTIVERLRERGFRFVTVGQMMAADVAAKANARSAGAAASVRTAATLRSGAARARARGL
jgi:peptidoglycan/xylan/chitin deacetylase (PgdA/CDA1 family)